MKNKTKQINKENPLFKLVKLLKGRYYISGSRIIFDMSLYEFAKYYDIWVKMNKE